MLNHLLASHVDNSLVRKPWIYTDPPPLIIDELGYLSLDQQSSNLFFQVISTRHSRNVRPLLPRTRLFSEWGNILHTHDLPGCYRRPSGRELQDFPARRRKLSQRRIRTIRLSSKARRLVQSRRRCVDIPNGGVRRVAPQRRSDGAGDLSRPFPQHLCSTSAPITGS